MDLPKPLLIRILGTPGVDGLPRNYVFPAKGFQLLALLATASLNKLPRKQVASLLWESATDKGALVNLRQLLMRLRKVLPASVIDVDGQSVWLGRDRSAIDLCLF